MNSSSCWWGWGKTEPDLRSLYEWIDRKSQFYGDTRGGVLGAVLGGTGGLMGGLIGVLVGGMQLNPREHPWALIGPLLGWAIIAAGMLWWYYAGRSREQRAIARAFAESRGFFYKLLSARWQGNIKGFIGEERARVLNEAAYEWMRCRNVLDGLAWQSVGGESLYAQARRDVGDAMDVAMARLLTAFGCGAPADSPEATDIVRTMRESAEEVARTAERLASGTGEGSPASELRSALEQVRSLNAAHDEVSTRVLA